MFARYHKEGTDPHRQTPNRNGDLRGDEEGKAKAKAISGSGGGIETLTGGHKENGKALTGVHKTHTGTLQGEENSSTKAHTGGHARDQEEGNDGTKAPTEEQRPKDNLTGRHDARDHNEGDDSTKTSTRTWTLDSAKTPTEVQRAKDDLTGTLDARDHNEGDDSANTIVMCTKPLRKSNGQRLQSTSFQRSGTEMQ